MSDMGMCIILKTCYVGGEKYFKVFKCINFTEYVPGNILAVAQIDNMILNNSDLNVILED